MEPFNSQTIDLQGSNIIEASAGTGKTYSIALEPWTNKWSATPEVDMVKHHWPVLKPFESKTTSLKASVF